MTRDRIACARHRRLAVAAMAPLLLAGCVVAAPFQQPYAWTATGSNAADLAAMAESPADLAQGRASEPADGLMAAAAVERLRTDHRRSLDATATSAVTNNGGAGGSAAGGSASGGGAAGGGASGASTPQN